MWGLGNIVTGYCLHLLLTFASVLNWAKLLPGKESQFSSVARFLNYLEKVHALAPAENLGIAPAGERTPVQFSSFSIFFQDYRARVNPVIFWFWF